MSTYETTWWGNPNLIIEILNLRKFQKPNIYFKEKEKEKEKEEDKKQAAELKARQEQDKKQAAELKARQEENEEDTDDGKSNLVEGRDIVTNQHYEAHTRETILDTSQSRSSLSDTITDATTYK